MSRSRTQKTASTKNSGRGIEGAIEAATIIEEYPNDPRGASCLIFGQKGKRPLHVLCGRLDAEEILVITAYEPDPTEWEGDWKTRKKR